MGTRKQRAPSLSVPYLVQWILSVMPRRRRRVNLQLANPLLHIFKHPHLNQIAEKYAGHGNRQPPILVFGKPVYGHDLLLATAHKETVSLVDGFDGVDGIRLGLLVLCTAGVSYGAFLVLTHRYANMPQSPPAIPPAMGLSG
jgi:hypothetical protein